GAATAPTTTPSAIPPHPLKKTSSIRAMHPLPGLRANCWSYEPLCRSQQGGFGTIAVRNQVTGRLKIRDSRQPPSQNGGPLRPLDEGASTRRGPAREGGP